MGGGGGERGGKGQCENGVKSRRDGDKSRDKGTESVRSKGQRREERFREEEK